MNPSYAEPTIVEVVTPWCGACRSMRSDIATTAAAYASEVTFVVLDATETPEAARDLGITVTPTILGYRDGREVLRVVGRRSRAELDQMFTELAGGSDQPPALDRRADRVLRTATGLVLAAIGAVSGPAWLLVAIGAGFAAWGLRS